MVNCSPVMTTTHEKVEPEAHVRLVVKLPFCYPIVHKDRVATEMSRLGSVLQTKRAALRNIFLVTMEKEVGEKVLDSGEGIEVDGQKWTISGEPSKEVIEGPSPMRLNNRQPSATVNELRSIHHNFICIATLFPPELLSQMAPAQAVSDHQWLDSSTTLDPDPEWHHEDFPLSGILGLAPPYHHLPDTPFFRNARVIPPPIFNNDGLPTLQRITNRYLASMKDHDEQQELELEQMSFGSLLPYFNLAPGRPVSTNNNNNKINKKTNGVYQWISDKAIDQTDISWSPWNGISREHI